ncbi:aKG-HExxH-type peptide beta-hydroxylase [Nocardia sp. R6R-6]|uniref:aKG-HExxH-type peptide beta-hydroxylase n=1 Tax=Nocardia sp. R6R-6 TaxID=3459303 RepID=UPI00403D6ED5
MAATTARCADLHSELTGRILRKRADRTRRILAALGSLAPGIDLPVPEYDPESGPDAFDTALLHHAFQLAQFAVNTRAAALVRRALRLWLERDLIRERALRTAVGPVFVVSAADCLAVDDDRLGNRMYLLADPPSADERDTGRLAAVLDSAVEAALGAGSAVLSSSTAFVIVPETRELHEVCRSYTFDFLPGTAVLSWSEQPLRLGETLVHEATHSWLNECLDAEGVTFPEGRTYYSPWRNEDRPVFGIVHAALAFSKVIDYLSRVQPAAADTSYLASVLRQRLADERRSLEIGREAANRCFAMVGSEPLRAYLEEAVRRAGTVD